MSDINLNIQTDFGATDAGADDSSAFQAFNTYALDHLTQSMSLFFPNGTYDNPTYTAPLADLPGLVLSWLGDNSTFETEMFLGGSGPFTNDVEEHQAVINDVTAGAKSIVFSSLATAAIFSADVGDWVMVTGIDLQGSGYPPNSYYTEYHQVVAFDRSIGLMELDGPLTYSYKSTWPSYSLPPPAISQGGPGTVYVMPSSWVMDIEISDSTFTGASQIYMPARTASYTNCTSTGQGFVPTNNKTFTGTNVTFAGAGNLEFDKQNINVTLTNCNFDSLLFQSSNEYCTLDSCTFTADLNGTAKYMTVRDCTIGASLTFGVSGHGAALQATVTNTTATSVAYQRLFMLIGLFTYTSGGVLRIANADCPVLFGVPGANCVLFDQINEKNLGNPFVINDLTQDATYTYLHTDLTSDFPAGLLADATHIMVHPAPSITASNCSGCVDMLVLSRYPTGNPLYQYDRRSYGPGQDVEWASIPNLFMWGDIVEIRVDVTRAYTGAQSSCQFKFMGQFGCQTRDHQTGVVVVYLPSIDAMETGIRVIRPGDVVGGEGEDTGLDTDANWLVGSLSPFLDCNMAGDTTAQQPIINVTIVTNQYVVNATTTAVVSGADPVWKDYTTREDIDEWRSRFKKLEKELEGKKRLDRDDADEIMALVNTAAYGVSPVPVQTIQAEVSQLLAEPPKVKQYDGQFGFGDVTIAKVMGQLREYEARMREEAMTREEVSLLDFLMMQ